MQKLNLSSRPGEKHIYPYLYIIPSLILIAGVYLYPFIDLFRISFAEGTIISGITNYVGLDNYKNLFSYEFLMIAKRTGIWIIGSVPFAVLVGLIGALVFNKEFKGRSFFRILILVPWVIPQNIVGIIWRWFLDSSYGTLNIILLRIGIIEETVSFLSADYALLSACIMRFWRATPFATITILAGLQSIPEDILEAACIDGASAWQIFYKIKLPLLKPVIGSTTLILTIWTLIIFDMVFTLTGGGPMRRTEIFALNIYRKAFQGYELGSAASMSVIGILFLIIIIGVYFKFMGEEV